MPQPTCRFVSTFFVSIFCVFIGGQLQFQDHCVASCYPVLQCISCNQDILIPPVMQDSQLIQIRQGSLLNSSCGMRKISTKSPNRQSRDMSEDYH